MTEINPNTRASSTKFVYVGCKLPHGLVLEIFDERPEPEPNANFLTLLRRPPLARARFILKGANSLKNDYTLRALAQPSYDYAVNCVPEDLWRAWYAKHQTDACCRNGFVFALPTEKQARAEGKVRASEPTGLEPMKPECERDENFQRITSTPGAQAVHHDPERLRNLQAANGREA